MAHDTDATCQTEGCAMQGVAITGLDNAPADLPVVCGTCGEIMSPGTNPWIVADPQAPDGLVAQVRRHGKGGGLA
jgi:hypothetical protein